MHEAGAVAAAAVTFTCCCWLLCARQLGSRTADVSSGLSPEELDRLRQEVARAEKALESSQQPDGASATMHQQNQQHQQHQHQQAKRHEKKQDTHQSASGAECSTDGSVPAWLSRSTLLLGDGAMGRLAKARVLLVGLGGVGGYTAEFLARAGIGHITIVDGDTVDPTNRNRQLVALTSTEGQPKSTVLAERIRDINPHCHVTALHEFVPAVSTEVDALVASEPFDFVIDAIDSLQPKVELIRAALKHRVRVVSSMGAGGRLDPSKVIVTDLSQMQWDRTAIRTAKRAGNRSAAGPIPHEKLGATVRKMLEKQYGIVGGVTIITSEEFPKQGAFELTPDRSKHKASFYGTCSFIPAAFGLHAAGIVVNALACEGQSQSKKERALRKAGEQAAAKH